MHLKLILFLLIVSVLQACVGAGKEIPSQKEIRTEKSFSKSGFETVSKFGEWRVLCPKGKTKNGYPCFMSHAAGNSGETGELRVDVITAHSSRYVRIFVGPQIHGQKGIRYGLDGKLEFSAPFSECQPTFCYVDLKLNAKDIRSLNSSSLIVVSLGSSSVSTGFTYTLANQGFKQAYEAWNSL